MLTVQIQKVRMEFPDLKRFNLLILMVWQDFRLQRFLNKVQTLLSQFFLPNQKDKAIVMMN